MINRTIKYMRESAGYNQTELAKKLNIAQTTLSGYETDYSKPNYEIVERIAKLCDFEIIFIDKNSGEKVVLENPKND